MAKSRICTVPDCGKKHFARGWCRTHYVRWWSKGDVGLVPGRALNGQTEAFLRSHMDYSGDDCVDWPYGKGGGLYGQARVMGEDGPASRWMCRLVHGEPPTLSHQAAHSCGRSMCVNPRHLRWATAAENASDRMAHGTHPSGENNGFAKLTEADVQAIRAASPHRTGRELADKYGVTESRINAIINRIGWKHSA